MEQNAVARIRLKLQQKLQNGNFYEAHQIYRTLYFRYCHQQKYDEILDILIDGAFILFEANQISSGIDISLLIIDVLDKSKQSPSLDIINKLSKLHRYMNSDIVGRDNFVGTVRKWSTKQSTQLENINGNIKTTYTHLKPPKPRASECINAEFGLNYWHEKNYVLSRYHLIRSLDGDACACMLIEYQITCGYPNEVDLFITQAVLQFLCLQNRFTAETCFSRYIKDHPQVEKGPPFYRPLLNFIWLLLLTLDRGSLTLFTVLCEQYKISLDRDPSYNDYLYRIGQLFFNVPVPTRQNNFGLFGSLMPELIKSDDDYDERYSSSIELD